MKRWVLVLSIGVLLVSAGARADEGSSLVVVPSIGLGYTSLRFNRPSGTVNAAYRTINVGISANSGRLYGSYNTELFGSDFLQQGTEYKSLVREEYSFTAGYLVTEKLNVFGGFAFAEVKDDFTGEFHVDNGPFVGVGYSRNFDHARLSFNIAYADMAGSITNEGSGVSESGRTAGFSYGVSWAAPYRQSMNYLLSLRVRNYDYRNSATSVVTDKDIITLSGSLLF
jgi:hypothetical protein